MIMEKQVSFRTTKMEKQQSFRGVMEKQESFRGGVIEKKMEKQQSFRGGIMEKKMEKQQSFRGGIMEKQKSFRGLMEKQKSFRIAMERQLSFGGEKKKSKESPGKRGDSPLHLAARGGNLLKVKDIFQRFDGNSIIDLISKKNQEGETALYVAAENGNAIVVGEFLKHIDLQTASIAANNGYDPFHVAAKQGHLEVLKELLRSFPNLVMTTDSSNSTALHTAAALGHIDVVNLLLDADSNLAKIARNNGKTVLHTAARMGHLEVVKSLLSKDPSIGFRTDLKGQTALHMAVKGKNVEIVLELIKPDPSVMSLEDSKGNTALHIATRKGCTRIVRCLVSIEGVNINAANKAGETPLDIAVKFGTPELVTILKEAGANYGKPPTAAKQLKQTVSDIKHDVRSQIQQTRQTGFRVKKIAKRIKKLHISGLNNAINSATVVAVLIATVAFAAIFTVPGQYVEEPRDGYSLGQAHIAKDPAFMIFFLFDSLALFISLAVVVVQTSVVVIEEKEKKQLMFVINKLMWLACLSISISFISLTYVVVGTHERWLAVYATIVGSSIMLTTIGSMCYCVVRQELLKRKKLEAEALEAIKKVKAFESAHAHEVELKGEAEDGLRTIIQEQEKLLEEREEIMRQLHKTMRSIALLDRHAQEANRQCKDAAEELKLIQASIATLRQEKQKFLQQKIEATRKLEKHSGESASANCNEFIGFDEDPSRLAEFSLSDLQTAACDFAESFKIGHGGYGSVYKGEMLDRTVAIKKLHPQNMQGQSEFQQEVQILRKLEHPHLVTLIGVCLEAWALVYEYLPNGSLQDCLFQKSTIHSLNWKTRARIISEIASALLFLHSLIPGNIVHGDLKPENILLNSELLCKISDYGICRLVPEGTLRCPSFRQYTEPKGAFPYTDPEFRRTGILTPSFDIYSFGLIILQLLTGRTPAELTTEVRKAVSYGNLASILDSSAGEWSSFVARRLVDLGLQCCELNSRDRPKLTPSLVRELEKLHVLEEQPVPSFFLCPILQEIMHDPQVAADGFTYEGEALRGWLESGRETSPMTNLKLSHLHLTPNHALRFTIQDWLCNSSSPLLNCM